MKLVSAQQMREMDAAMIRDYGVSALSLMEKAGAGVTNLVLQLFERNPWPRKVLLFAGRGNNGGDAFVAARLLEAKGVQTQTLLLASTDEVKGIAQESLKKLKAHGVHILETKTSDDLRHAISNFGEDSIAVDGLVGTGTKGALQGVLAEAADMMSSRRFLATVAIDIPSGLDPDEGKPSGHCVRADYTVTMGLPKLGLVKHEGLDWSGKIHVVDLEIPEPLLKAVEGPVSLIAVSDLILPPARKRLSHKGDYGHVFILGGSPGLTGAPTLASLAALRAGAGLVTVGVGESLNFILETKLTESMTLPLPEAKPGYVGLAALEPILKFLSRAAALVIGPGLSTQEETVRLVHELISRVDVPMVIDADGLNAVAKDPAILHQAKAPVILTPHPGEMARLTNQTVREIEANRWEFAGTMAKEFDVITVLKGAATAVASSDGLNFINATGHAGMATGGMGDLLAGIIGAFLAQGMDPLEASKLAVYLHGACGDEVAFQKEIDQGLLASDLLEFIPKQLKFIAYKTRFRLSPE